MSDTIELSLFSRVMRKYYKTVGEGGSFCNLLSSYLRPKRMEIQIQSTLNILNSATSDAEIQIHGIRYLIDICKDCMSKQDLDKQKVNMKARSRDSL